MSNWHKETGGVRWLVIAGLLGLAAAIPRRGDREGTRAPCQSNLKRIALALQQYAQDCEERLPAVQGNGKAFGWADALGPYIKSIEVFQCDVHGSGSPDGVPSSTEYTYYWLSGRLAGRVWASIDDSAGSILFGEGNDGIDLTDGRYSLSAFPSRWIADLHSPLYRHFETANYAFADGHVKALKPSLVDNPKWTNGPKLKRLW